MNVFVTGATGFIGRRLVRRLVDDGHSVRVLVRGVADGLPSAVETVRGDLLDDSLGGAGEGCERLYHLAALVTFDSRLRADLLAVNGEGTVRLLAAAERWGVERTVVVSSACTLGLSDAAERVLDESSPLDPRLAARNPYLESKLAAERAARGAVVVNPTTCYGPGDRSLNSGTLVKKVAEGSVLPVPPGGSNVVDVDDVVEGILLAGDRGRVGERYVLGGSNLAFAEIMETIAEAVGRRPRWVPVPRASRPLFGAAAWMLGKLTGSRFLTPQIVEDLFAFKYYSSDKARRELGYAPRFTFAESVGRAWKFYTENGLMS